MTTICPDELIQLAAQWKAIYASAVFSGCVGDLSHRIRGGYHVSREDQTDPQNYSVIRPDDKLGPDDCASGLDMNLDPADMKLCTSRLVKAYSDPSDPRRKYINAFNGTVDGKNAQRWDVYACRVDGASSDHLWHVHISIRRRYCTSATAMKAILSILKGESVNTYLLGIGVTPVSVPAYPGRVLRRNDAQAKPDPAVKVFQARMLARGWESVGSADGYFGPKLESVVKRWQADCALDVDGMIGPKTWPTPWSRPLGG